MTKREAKKRALAWAAADLKTHWDDEDGSMLIAGSHATDLDNQKCHNALGEVIDELYDRGQK